MDYNLLLKLYDGGLSMMQIAKSLNCSPHKVQYWMDKHAIKRRSISEAIYLHNHPDGDPFRVRELSTSEDYYLLGLGVGLYWGEGTKAHKNSISLGNSDPKLINIFMEFLIKLYGVERRDFRFGLQTFTDIETQTAFTYWTSQLHVSQSQFYKAHVTPSGSIGTYCNKSKYGVLTVHYHNTKLRDIIVGLLPR